MMVRRMGTAITLILIVLTPGASQEKISLSINFVPGGTATRVITARVKGEWHGPMFKSPEKPLTVPFEADARLTFYLAVASVTPEGNGVIVVQPQGMKVTVKAGDRAFEFHVNYEGDVKVNWDAFSFDSTKLPREEREKLRKFLTASYEVVITPQGKVKETRLPGFLKEELPEHSVLIIQNLIMNLLTTLLPIPFPERPVAVGESWKDEIPIPPIFEEETPPLTVTCTVKEVRDDRAIVLVQVERKGPTSLTLRHPEAPKVRVTGGQLKAKGEMVFLLSLGVPQKTSWQVDGEATGTVTVIRREKEGSQKGKKVVPFTLRFSVDLTDELIF